GFCGGGGCRIVMNVKSIQLFL
ncbi:hypothetical protein A2U01_0074125, partial [Trifolium medium]|nr:hypothetical protein [Trifolium medium]